MGNRIINRQAVSYYQFTMVNYIGFYDKGMLLAGGCGGFIVSRIKRE